MQLVERPCLLHVLLLEGSNLFFQLVIQLLGLEVLLLKVQGLLALLISFAFLSMQFVLHLSCGRCDFLLQVGDPLLLFLDFRSQLVGLLTISPCALFVFLEHLLALAGLYGQDLLLSLGMPELVFDLDKPLAVLALVCLECRDLLVLFQQQVLGEAARALALLPLECLQLPFEFLCLSLGFLDLCILLGAPGFHAFVLLLEN